MIYRVAISYLKILKDIDKKISEAEEKMLGATKNEELLNLLALENSLTYIITALKSNGVVLDKILKGNVIEMFVDDEDLLEDAIIENNQAIEMADLYRGILSSTTDTVATIISNNLNSIMKFLAGITIVFLYPNHGRFFHGNERQFRGVCQQSICLFLFDYHCPCAFHFGCYHLKKKKYVIKKAEQNSALNW